LSPGEASRDEHAELAHVLAEAGADLLLCETFPSPSEAVVAVEEAVRTGLEAWAALTPGPEGTLLSPAQLVRGAERCARAGARVVLVNCVAASRALPYVAAIARLGVPFGVYANAGEPSEGLGWGVPDGARAAARYAEYAKRWRDQGATVIGGCCGTGPAHVAAIAQLGFSSRTSTRP
jgi:S-methylmethionine-dependent homocysteine/selenocysteine methylase